MPSDLTTFTIKDLLGDIDVNPLDWHLVGNARQSMYGGKNLPGLHDGDYNRRFRFKLNVVPTRHSVGVWVLTESLIDDREFTILNDRMTLILVGRTTGGVPYIQILEYQFGSLYGVTIALNLVIGTDYYPEVIRDESIGAFGQTRLIVHTVS